MQSISTWFACLWHHTSLRNSEFCQQFNTCITFPKASKVSAGVLWSIYLRINVLLLGWLWIWRWSPAFLQGHENRKKQGNTHFAEIKHLMWISLEKQAGIELYHLWLAFLLLWLNCRRSILPNLQHKKTRSRTNHGENRHKCRKTNYDQKCNSEVVMHHPGKIEQATDEH